MYVCPQIFLYHLSGPFPAIINLFYVNNGNTSATYGISSKLKLETPERRQRRSGVFIVNFEQILHIILVFLFLTLTT